jgi:hypothetical protein
VDTPFEEGPGWWGVLHSFENRALVIICAIRPEIGLQNPASHLLQYQLLPRKPHPSFCLECFSLIRYKSHHSCHSKITHGADEVAMHTPAKKPDVPK